MTGSQLKALIIKAGKTQVGLARELGIGERTMRAYIAAKRVPQVIEYAARHACECENQW
jgi:predicted transcriptional regulator